MDEFRALDKKIKSYYEIANEDEEKRFAPLARLFAQKQVEDFKLTAEEQKQLL